MKNFKHWIFIFMVSLFPLTSCKKVNSVDSGSNPYTNINNNNNSSTVNDLSEVGSVPSAFTQKVLLEEFTGEWCGWCPEGAKIMNDNISANPGRVIGIAVHDGDPMEVPSYNNWIKTLTGVSGFPNGSVNRADATGRGSWTSQINTELNKTAELGIAMTTKANGGLYNIKVFIGYVAAINNSTNLTIAVIEDDVPQSPGGQSNYSSTVVVDANWRHNHVLRGLVTANGGDPITLNSPKGWTAFEYNNIDLSTMGIKDMNNVHIVAFVNVNTTPRLVYNVQDCGLKEVKKWD